MLSGEGWRGKLEPAGAGEAVAAADAGDGDYLAFRGSMNHAAAANVDAHVIDGASEEYQVTRSQLGEADRGSGIILCGC